MRRLFALAAVLMISGFVPLLASAGLCAPKRCCHTKAGTSVSGSTCCTPSNCLKAPDDPQATAQTNGVAPVSGVQAAPVILASVSVSAPIGRTASTQSPPPTQRRLAALSILLV